MMKKITFKNGSKIEFNSHIKQSDAFDSLGYFKAHGGLLTPDRKITIKKKGKTVGRPSNMEKRMSAFASWFVNSQKKTFDQLEMDQLAYGVSFFKIGKNGKIKRINPWKK